MLRQHGARAEVLVFAHPSAGTQLVKGTVEVGESVEDAAVRELAEESGITGAACLRDLGQWVPDPGDQIWHFWEMAVPQALPDAWSHVTQDDGGQVVAFCWHPIAEPPSSSWQALRSATSVAATCLQLDRELGTLEPGKRADLLVLEASPLERIQNIRRQHSVWIGGERVRR